jgi:NADH:ubiquinone oxidoreductase subunit E
MIVMYTIVTRYVFWVVILSTAPLGYGLEIQVCQNKHCCQNYAKANHHIVTSTPAGNDLVQTMRQLVPQATVKASGCLSQCDYGPNIQIATGKEESIHNQIFTPEAAAAALELSGVEVDMTLITAVKVMAQAEKG